MRNTIIKKIQTVLLALLVSGIANAAEGTNILQTPSVALSAERITGTYDLHLYFGNTAPYLDFVHFQQGSDGRLIGQMNVPNDFDAGLEDLAFSESAISFKVLVPRNNSRPEDMIFLYEGLISPHDTSKFAGHVTLTKRGDLVLAQPEYVGSFVMFKQQL